MKSLEDPESGVRDWESQHSSRLIIVKLGACHQESVQNQHRVFCTYHLRILLQLQSRMNYVNKQCYEMIAFNTKPNNLPRLVQYKQVRTEVDRLGRRGGSGWNSLELLMREVVVIDTPNR